MSQQALHIPTGEENQSLTVAGKTIKMKKVTIRGRDFMVPTGITRNQYNGWALVLRRDGMTIVSESFADGTYNGLTGHALTHAIDRLIEVLEEHEASKQ